MKNGILKIALAAGTMLAGVHAASAELLPANRDLGQIEDNQQVDITITENDPAVNDITVGMDPALGLVADYEKGSIRLHGTLLSKQPWGSRAFSVVSFDASGNLINFATYQIATKPEALTPIVATDLSVTTAAGTTVMLTRSDLIEAGDDDPEAEISYMFPGGLPAGLHPSADSGGNLKVSIDPDSLSAEFGYLIAKSRYPATPSYSEIRYIRFDVESAEVSGPGDSGPETPTPAACHAPEGVRFVFRYRSGMLPC